MYISEQRVIAQARLVGYFIKKYELQTYAITQKADEIRIQSRPNEQSIESLLKDGFRTRKTKGFTEAWKKEGLVTFIFG